jgi:Protein of unknown function (DUF3137)
MQKMISLPDVNTLMTAGLAKWLENKAADRLEAKKQMYTAGIAGAGVALAVVILSTTFDFFPFGYFGAAFVFGGGLMWANGIRQKMVNTLKQEMNGALAKAMEIEYDVIAIEGPEFARACTYDLLPSHDDSTFSDAWQGSVAGTRFQLYEAELTEQQGSGKSRRIVTVFQGILIQLRFARDFLGITLVRREGFKFTLFGDSKKYDGQTLDRITMVDPAFEDAFDVYGSDPVEARYLVHPAYCERLLALEHEFDGSKLAALFIGGDLLISIHTEDMFESASLNPSEDKERLGKTISQFGSLIQLITHLNERERKT